MSRGRGRDGQGARPKRNEPAPPGQHRLRGDAPHPKQPRGAPQPVQQGQTRGAPHGGEQGQTRGAPHGGEQGQTRGAPRGGPEHQTRGGPRGQTRGAPHSGPQGQTRGAPQATPQSALRGESQDQTRGAPRATPQSALRGESQGQTRGAPQGQARGAPQGQTRGAPQGQTRGAPQVTPQGGLRREPQAPQQRQPRIEPQPSPQRQPQRGAGDRPRWRVTKPLRETIAAGHPWVYDRALEEPRGLAAGEVTTLIDDRGPIATALADPTSPIRARILDLDPDAICDGTWAAKRAEAAAARRARDPLLVGCTGRRLIHGEGDACPGLVIDQYMDTAVVVFDGAAAAAFWRPRIEDVLAGLARGGAELGHVWLRGERGDRASAEALRGDPPAEIVIAEDEARFGVDVRAGQKTGFFLDQRDNRRTVRRHAAGQTVLNLFSYTGGFSLHAALGGATRVTSVDIAAPAIAALERNITTSGLAADAHECVALDAFEFLTRARAQGRRWDLVIVDPPSFAPSERAKPAALRAYERLASAALAVVEPGGRFAFASCSSHVAEADLLVALPSAAGGADLRLRLAAGAGSDHPVLAAFPEGRYLKFLFFDVG